MTTKKTLTPKEHTQLCSLISNMKEAILEMEKLTLWFDESQKWINNMKDLNNIVEETSVNLSKLLREE